MLKKILFGLLFTNAFAYSLPTEFFHKNLSNENLKTAGSFALGSLTGVGTTYCLLTRFPKVNPSSIGKFAGSATGLVVLYYYLKK